MSAGKKRIAILAEALDNQNAGIHVYLKNLVSGLKAQNQHEYILIRMQKSTVDYGLESLILKPLPIPGYMLFRKLVHLPLFLRKHQFDAVIEPAHFGPFFLKKGTKRITIIHDLTPVLFPQFHPLHSVILHKVLLRGILKRADLVVTNSHNTSKDLIDYCPGVESKIRMVYPAINPIFKRTLNEEVLKKYKITEDYFLSVGTFEPRKDHLTIVKAFELYKEANPESKNVLVLAGRRGWKSKTLFQYINKSTYKKEIIILLNVLTDHLPILYSHCTAFIYASIYEGYGFPVVEAHNCGAKCIVARNSSLEEVGKGIGLFFETSNHQNLSGLLKNDTEQIDKTGTLKGKDIEYFGKMFESVLN